MTKNIFLFFAISLLMTSSCTSHINGLRKSAPEENVDVKLPNDVVPSRYEITLWTNPLSDHFSGQVTIDIDVMSERKDIFIHAKDLQIVSANLAGAHGEIEGKFKQLNEDGLARIDFGKWLAKDSYRLTLSYRAKYSDDLSGLYRVKDGSDNYLYTQFEPLAARKMLPCFDEPRFKTPFDVKVISPVGQIVIANSPAKAVFQQDGEEVHVFETTKPISTYLLALAVGPFDVVDGPTIATNEFRNRAVNFRGIATRGKGEKLKFALQETPQIVAKLEQYFGVEYPYQKLDILAVPDFSAGAMENVGAITFREWYLLLDEKTASIDQRRNFYLVMAHELAHQWFGNLVTMPWWDDLWLNEAFATWLSYKIVDDMKPSYKSQVRLLDRSHSTMFQDSLLSARKIREPITSTHDVHNAFDGITYSKGGAVLSMLENYLGKNAFRNAVSSHIKRFAEKTATSRDFLESLAKFSEPSLVNSAETFLNQTGVPHVKVSYRCENNQVKIKAEQSRYVPIGSKVTSTSKWHIPMCIGYEAKGSVKKHCFTLQETSTKIDLPNAACPKFIMPNAQGQGYYRFSLNLEAWKDLLAAKPSLLSESDRLAIADSLVAELNSGGLDFAFVMESLHGLVDANSALLTGYFMSLIEAADNFFVSEENRAHALAYAHKALRDIYDNLTRTKDISDDQVLLVRNIASFFAHVVKDKQTRFDLSLLGTAYLHHSANNEKANRSMDKYDENFLDDAVAMSMQLQDDSNLEKMSLNLANETDTVTRGHLLFGLAKSREGNNANFIRSLIFNDSLRRNEKLQLFYMHLANPRNQPATWQFLKNNFAKFKKTLSNQQLANLPYLADGLCTFGDAQEVKQFFSPFIANYEGGPRTLAGMTEQIEICAAIKSHASTLANRFFENVKEETVAEQERSKQ